MRIRTRRSLALAGLIPLLGLAAGVGVGCDRAGDTAGELPGFSRPADPDAAGARVRAILREDDLLERTARLAALLSHLEPEALPGVRAAFDDARFHPGETEVVLLVDWWARFDPEAALQWALSEWKAEHPRVLAELFRAWGRHEPRAALARARQTADPAARSDYALAALVGWDESGAPGLLEYVRGLPAGPERQRAIRMLAQSRVVELGVEEAIRWADALAAEGDGFKLNAIRRVASTVAEIDPRRAAAWAETHLGGPLGSGLPRRVATRWVKREPEAALAWLASLSEGRNRDDGVEETYRDWLKHDHESAWAWMREATETGIDPWLEPAYAIYARSISSRDPEGALRAAGRIRDEALRDRTRVVLVRWWLQRDREAALAWLDAAELPEDVRRRALSVPGASGRADGPQPRES